MSKQADLILQGDVFMVKGDIDFSNVMSLRQKSLAQFNHKPEIMFDLSQVTSSDSSGLALVIEWLKIGKKNNTTVHLQHITDDLMMIAKASGLNVLIPNS